MPDLNWWLEQHFYLLTLFYFNILPRSHIYVQSISQMEFSIFSWKSHKRIQLWRVFFTLGEIYVYYIYILALYTIIYVYTCAFRFFTFRESRSGENFTELFLFQCSTEEIRDDYFRLDHFWISISREDRTRRNNTMIIW